MRRLMATAALAFAATIHALPATTRQQFTDVASSSGISFRHAASKTGEKFLPETMGGGVAIFDLPVRERRARPFRARRRQRRAARRSALAERDAPAGRRRGGRSPSGDRRAAGISLIANRGERVGARGTPRRADTGGERNE